MLRLEHKGGIDMTDKNELDYMCGISDDELTQRFKESIKIDNEIRKIKGLPIAGFDEEKNKPFIEYPDGRRQYAN